MKRRESVRRALGLHAYSSWPAVRRHPARVFLIVLVVGLGVATIVATGSLVESAVASSERAIRATAVSVDLQVSNGFVGVPEALIERIREISGVAAAAGIIQSSVRTGVGDSETELLLVGVDLLGEDSVHGRSLERDRFEIPDETLLLTRLDAVIVARPWAADHAVEVGASLPVTTVTGRHELYVVGFFDPGAAAVLADGAVVLMDLPALQILLARGGLVDAVDVEVETGADLALVQSAIADQFKGVATVSAPTLGSLSAEALLFNLRLILNIVGFIAIAVSFLITLHVTSLAVAQRRAELDVIHEVGASHRSIRAMFLREALILGSAGSAVGVALGIALAWAASSLFHESVSTLYGSLGASAFRVSAGYTVLGAAIGILTTSAATWANARSRDSASGGGILVAQLRRDQFRHAKLAAIPGLAFLGLSAASTLVQDPSLSVERLMVAVTIGDFLLLFGLALLVPGFLLAIASPVHAFLSRTSAVLPGLAWRGICSQPARSGTVLCSLMVGLGYVVITVAVVGSLRSYVDTWVEHSFQADLVVSAAGYFGILPSAPALPGELRETIASHPQVKSVEGLRVVTQPYRERWIMIASRPARSLGTSYPVHVLDGDLDHARAAVAAGSAAVVSGHFAEKFHLAAGDSIELRSPSGPVRFEIGAIIDDFLADLGTVLIDDAVFRERWKDEGVSSFHIWVTPGADLELVGRELGSIVREHCDCVVRNGAQFRKGFDRVLDAAFQTAYAIEAVAGIVATTAVTSFFVLTLWERRREFQLLFTIGMSRSQLVRRLLLEGVGIGTLGGMFACLCGFLISYRLVRTTMHASGGLDVPYVLPAWFLAAVVLGAIALSLAASLVPVLRWSPSIEKT